MVTILLCPETFNDTSYKGSLEIKRDKSMEGTWRVEHQMLEVCVQCDVKDLWIKNEDFWCRLLCLCVVFWIWKA